MSWGRFDHIVGLRVSISEVVAGRFEELRFDPRENEPPC